MRGARQQQRSVMFYNLKRCYQNSMPNLMGTNAVFVVYW